MAKQSKGQSAGLGTGTRILLLHGPDPVAKREALERLSAALEAEHGELEWTRFDGREANAATVLDELRTFSMLGRYKVVVVDAAEELITSNRSVLERYAERPVSGATLVLRAEQIRPGKLEKRIESVGAVVACEPPDAAAARRWLVETAEARHGASLAPEAADALIERVGADRQRLETELEKLATMAGSAGAIGAELVMQQVGAAGEARAWALQTELFEALAANRFDAERPIATAREAVELTGESDVLLLFVVADGMRKLASGARLREAGVSEREIPKRVGVFGPGRDPYLRALKRVGPRAATRLLDRAMALDRRSKSGLGTAARAVETFCARQTAAAGGERG